MQLTETRNRATLTAFSSQSTGQQDHILVHWNHIFHQAAAHHLLGCAAGAQPAMISSPWGRGRE